MTIRAPQRRAPDAGSATSLVGADGLAELARLAAVVAQVPLAFISVIDDTRAYWNDDIHSYWNDASRSDWNSAAVPDRARPAPQPDQVLESLSRFLVAAGGPAVIDDARRSDIPVVAEFGIGAWAGHPIRGLSGEILGGFFVVSLEPRHWSEWEIQTLATLARAASQEVALREALRTSELRLIAMTHAHQVAIELARTLQDSLLPPTLPGVPGVQVAARYQAAGTTEVVGDFYDLFRVVGDWWCAVIGDVCGHGVEAAKVTALARYTLRADANLHEQPSTVLADLHDALVAQNGVGGRYLTAAYATFRVTDTGVDGRLCLGGHPRPVIRRADGTVTAIGVSGSILGAFTRVKLTDVDFHLDPGDLLLLYTDGLTERRKSDESQFGDVEFQRSVSDTAGRSAYDTIAAVVAAADVYSEGRTSDDTALLAIQVDAPRT